MHDPSDTAAHWNGNAMNSFDTIGFVDAMQRRLLARVNLADADYADVVEDKLELEALASIGEALKDAPEGVSLSWLVARMARLEARVEALARALADIVAVLPDAPALAPDAGAPTPAALESCVVQMNEDAVLRGFYYTEHTDTGVSIRWMGPEPLARVHVPKVRLPVELTLVLASVYKGVDLGAVRVALNDGPWTPVETRRSAGDDVLRCRPVPGRGGGGLVHHIDIDCGATFSPADEGSSDTRKLGIALSRIEIASVR